MGGASRLLLSLVIVVLAGSSIDGFVFMIGRVPDIPVIKDIAFQIVASKAGMVGVLSMFGKIQSTGMLYDCSFCHAGADVHFACTHNSSESVHLRAEMVRLCDAGQLQNTKMPAFLSSDDYGVYLWGAVPLARSTYEVHHVYGAVCFVGETGMAFASAGIGICEY